MHYKVEIETRPYDFHHYTAVAVSGPHFVRQPWLSRRAFSREEALRSLQGAIVMYWPDHSFDFVHTPA